MFGNVYADAYRVKLKKELNNEFPIDPFDGQKFTDTQGVQWKYHANINKWVKLKKCQRQCGCNQDGGDVTVKAPASTSAPESEVPCGGCAVSIPASSSPVQDQPSSDAGGDCVID